MSKVNNIILISILFSYGGGGFTPEYFENNISSYELGVMTGTFTNIFEEVFGPWAHCCPCEALEQKQPKKTNINERR